MLCAVEFGANSTASQGLSAERGVRTIGSKTASLRNFLFTCFQFRFQALSDVSSKMELSGSDSWRLN